MNSFLSLFYIAFYLQDQEKLKEVSIQHRQFFQHIRPEKVACLFHGSLQQLAALLIARQVIGNLKESALPYILEQLRLAKLSFDLFGALSPSVESKISLGSESGPEIGTGNTSEVCANIELNEESKPNSGSRNVSQAELESTLYKVI